MAERPRPHTISRLNPSIRIWFRPQPTALRDTYIAAAIAKSSLTIDDLIKYADKALYKAKHADRNRVEIADIE